MYKFAHIADCHLGAHRYEVLKELEIKAFRAAMEKCIEENVNFVIISGDIFDSNLPDLGVVNEAVQIMKKVKDSGIPIYVIYGSHDYSPNETSIVDILTNTGLLTKVVKGKVDRDGKLKLEFTVDPKTGAKITGISARKRGMERHYFEILDREKLEREDGFKIFAFHSAITELKPKEFFRMSSIQASFLPRGFNYYAGGHIHVKRADKKPGESGIIAYPGPLFAAEPRDLERTALGEARGFFLVEFDEEVRDVSFVETFPCDNYMYYEYDATNKSAKDVERELINDIKKLDVKGKIVILKIYGELGGGKTSDINFAHIKNILTDNGAIFVSLNRYGLRSKEYTTIKVAGESVDEIEEKLFKENIEKIKTSYKLLKGDEGVKIAKKLLSILRQEQKLNEKKSDYETRIIREALAALNLEEVIKV